MKHYMDKVQGEINGFTGRCVQHDPGIHVKVPGIAQEHGRLEAQQLIELEIRTKNGSVTLNRKLQKSGNNLKLYVPKQEREELGLEDGETVQVFYHKK